MSLRPRPSPWGETALLTILKYSTGPYRTCLDRTVIRVPPSLESGGLERYGRPSISVDQPTPLKLPYPQRRETQHPKSPPLSQCHLPYAKRVRFAPALNPCSAREFDSNQAFSEAPTQSIVPESQGCWRWDTIFERSQIASPQVPFPLAGEPQFLTRTSSPSQKGDPPARLSPSTAVLAQGSPQRSCRPHHSGPPAQRPRTCYCAAASDGLVGSYSVNLPDSCSETVIAEAK